MSRIVRPIVSPVGRIVVLAAATVWLLAATLISPPAESEAAQLQLSLTSLQRVDALAGLDDPFYKAWLMTATPSGDLLISDSGNSRVVRVRRDDPRTPLAVYGSPGQGPGELIDPRGVAVDADGNVFVADPKLGRVTKYAADGSYLSSASQPNAYAVVVNSAGEVLAWPALGEALLYRYDNDLGNQEPILEKTDVDKQRGNADALFVLDDRDRLYWIDQDELVVRVYDRALEKIDEWSIDPAGLREDIDTRLAQIRALIPEAGLNPFKHASIAAGGDLVLTYMESSRFVTAFVYSPSGELRRTLRGFSRETFAATFVSPGELVTTDGDAYELFSLSN